MRSDNEEKENKEDEKRRKGRGGAAINIRSNNAYLAGGKKNRNKEKRENIMKEKILINI